MAALGLRYPPRMTAKRHAGGGRVLVGASSWSERTLVHDSGWYPRRSMRAAERVAHYAARLDLVEIDATHRFPPTPELCRQWVERTPPGFTVDVQAWALLTGGGAIPDSLWADLRDEVHPERRDGRRLYLSHLGEAAREECWRRFRHALEPLRAAGRLGAVVLRYPVWLRPGATGRRLLAEARSRLADLPLAAELPRRAWLEGDRCEPTLSLLEDLGIAFVCVDSDAGPPVVATTTDLAVVRFAGRGAGGGEAGTPPARRYRPDELEPWVARVGELAAAAADVHLLFANTWRDCAVADAAALAALLG